MARTKRRRRSYSAGEWTPHRLSRADGGIPSVTQARPRWPARARRGECKARGERVSGCPGLSRVIGFVEGLRPEHRARDGEEPVGDGAQGAAVSVTARAQGGVLVLTGGVMLDGDASPVVDCVTEARVRGKPPDDDR